MKMIQSRAAVILNCLVEDDSLIRRALRLVTLVEAVERTLSPERAELVVQNMGLAVELASRYWKTLPDDIPFEEVLGQANAALARAAQYYQVSKSNEQAFKGTEEGARGFGAYASSVIRNELNRYFYTEVTRSSHERTTLDEPAHVDDDEETKTSQVRDPGDASSALRDRHDIEVMRGAIENLPDIERRAIGLFLQGETNEAIARKLRYSKMGITKIIQRAVGRLRSTMAVKGAGEIDFRSV